MPRPPWLAWPALVLACLLSLLSFPNPSLGAGLRHRTRTQPGLVPDRGEAGFPSQTDTSSAGVSPEEAALERRLDWIETVHACVRKASLDPHSQSDEELDSREARLRALEAQLELERLKIERRASRLAEVERALARGQQLRRQIRSSTDPAPMLGLSLLEAYAGQPGTVGTAFADVSEENECPALTWDILGDLATGCRTPVNSYNAAHNHGTHTPDSGMNLATTGNPVLSLIRCPLRLSCAECSATPGCGWCPSRRQCVHALLYASACPTDNPDASAPPLRLLLARGDPLKRDFPFLLASQLRRTEVHAALVQGLDRPRLLQFCRLLQKTSTETDSGALATGLACSPGWSVASGDASMVLVSRLPVVDHRLTSVKTAKNRKTHATPTNSVSTDSWTHGEPADMPKNSQASVVREQSLQTVVLDLRPIYGQMGNPGNPGSPPFLALHQVQGDPRADRGARQLLLQAASLYDSSLISIPFLGSPPPAGPSSFLGVGSTPTTTATAPRTTGSDARGDSEAVAGLLDRLVQGFDENEWLQDAAGEPSTGDTSNFGRSAGTGVLSEHDSEWADLLRLLAPVPGVQAVDPKSARRAHPGDSRFGAGPGSDDDLIGPETVSGESGPEFSRFESGPGSVSGRHQPGGESFSEVSFSAVSAPAASPTGDALLASARWRARVVARPWAQTLVIEMVPRRSSSRC